MARDARMQRMLLGVGLALAILMAGCGGSSVLAPVESRDGYGPAPPGYHRVLRGETLSSISRQTGHSVQRLAAWNDLGPPYPIKAGGLLRVEPPPAPGSPGRKVSSTSANRPPEKTPSQPKAAAGAEPARAQATVSGKVSNVAGVAWQWPLQGKIKQTYEAGNRSRQGVRIRAAPETKVKAAAKGSVVYSGSGLKGYGNLIIVKHNDQFLSVYGFNRRLIAKQGDRVRAGQVLAEVGQDPGGAHLLHFEIRRDGATVDPLDYLPQP
jgi:lipoprotein NlpD